MSANKRGESIEQSLSLLQDLDLDTCSHLVEAAGLLSEAEAAFTRLADPTFR